MSEQKKKIDLSAYFTREREESGVWTNLNIAGEPTGIKIRIAGLNSSKGMASQLDYTRSLDKLKTVKDSKERAEFILDAYAEHAANLVTGIEGENGETLYIDGEEFKEPEELIKEFLKNNREVVDFIINYAGQDKNFIKRNGG